MMNLILHPEQTVGLILRGELLDSTSRSTNQTLDQNVAYEVPGYTLNQVLRRRLLPKVPERDASLEQDCILYSEDSPDVTLVALFPLLQPGQKMPHYHPDVDALAFRYIPSKDGDTQALLRVDVVHRNSAGRDEGSRLYKTCVMLLEIIDRHGYGKLTGYKQRVTHDTVVPRNSYQDFYHIMKMRYQYLKEEWVESTDAVKNVFEASSIS
jgi:tRNASer (uridine44-2'-O)-methyltransferase